MSYPAVLKFDGSTTFFNLTQPEKAHLCMVSTLFGISICSKLLQFLNANSPITVTVSGIVTLISPLQFTNTLDTILVVPSSKAAACKLAQL